MDKKELKGMEVEVKPSCLIELKPNRKYVFVVTIKDNPTQSEFNHMADELSIFIKNLNQQGYDLEGLLLSGDVDVKVIKATPKREKAR